jgi:hypothetical protein
MSFELNLAIIPNRIYYLEGVQLSYIKIYVHIFNLWHSNRPCFIGVDEFVERTQLAKSTVYEALLYFEKMNEIKRVSKGRKKYILQPTRFIETEEMPVDKPAENRTKNNLHSEMADDNSELADKNSANSEHNNKYNNKYKKSSCLTDEQKKRKAENEKKPEWASGKKSPMASVEVQSTSYNKTKTMETAEQPSKHVIEYQKRQSERTAKPADELPPRAEVRVEIPNKGHNGGQGAAITPNRGKGGSSEFRGRHGLLAACSPYLHSEETGMAGDEDGRTNSTSEGRRTPSQS